MSLRRKALPNLFGGVSQQPASLRFENQCDALDNGYPSIVDGVTKRPPLELIAGTTAPVVNDEDDYFVHFINRDPTERYAVVIESSTGVPTIRVVSVDGTVQTVNTPDGVGYLLCDDAATDLRAVTIADYTFIVNRTKTVAMDATTSSTRDNEALYFVRQGDYGTKYAYAIDEDTVGLVTGNTTTPDGALAADRLDIATDQIADTLEVAMTSGLSGDFTVTRSGSVIHLENSTNDFTVNATDGLGDGAMVAIKDSVSVFSDLPTHAPNGYRVKVEGDPESDTDDYYVEFEAENGSFGVGKWIETNAPGITYKLDPTTMPHVLIRQADGDFRLAAVDGDTYTADAVNYDLPVWGERIAGDLTTNPDPSFVGKQINDVFLFKNRLGFLADENVILGETAEFFNFYRTTVSALLDTSVIDIASPTAKVSILQSAIPTAERLVLFSEQSQFILQGGTVLSPKTVSMNLTSQYESISSARPVVAGSSIFFPFGRGDWAGVREYFLADDVSTVFESNDVTEQIPRYINGTIRDIASSTIENVLVLSSTGERDSMYVYKYYNSNRERVQSAWSKFEFTNASVLGMEFIDTDLYVVLRRDDTILLEKMTIEPAFTDAGYSYKTLLDSRVDQSDCVVTATTVTLPYKVYTGDTVEIITKTGERIPIVTQTDDSATVTIATDLTATDFWAGVAYTMTYTLSEPTVRDNQDNSLVSLGRVQLRNIAVTFDRTGYFRVEATPLNRDTIEKVFSGRVLGDGSSIIGSVSISSGDFRVPLLSKSNQITINLVNDSPLPCSFTGIEYEIEFTQRYQGTL